MPVSCGRCRQRETGRDVSGALCGITQWPHAGFPIIDSSRLSAANRAAGSPHRTRLKNRGLYLRLRSFTAGRPRIATGCSQAGICRIVDVLAMRASLIRTRSFRRAGQHAHTCDGALPDAFALHAALHQHSARRAGLSAAIMGGATRMDAMLHRVRRRTARPAASLRCCNQHARFARVRCVMAVSHGARDYPRMQNASRIICAIQARIAGNGRRRSCGKVVFGTDRREWSWIIKSEALNARRARRGGSVIG